MRRPLEERIRLRLSYTRWQRIIEVLDNELRGVEFTANSRLLNELAKVQKIKTVLEVIHRELDNERAYGTERRSHWSYESLQQAIADHEAHVRLDYGEDQTP